ncbi:hypothetical protein KPB2_5571 [Klebsiella pneumoniae Kb677]|nr:hypothetical protein KPB2_5571 [Klebsiella pneumoniae Kb677]
MARPWRDARVAPAVAEAVAKLRSAPVARLAAGRRIGVRGAQLAARAGALARITLAPKRTVPEPAKVVGRVGRRPEQPRRTLARVKRLR